MNQASSPTVIPAFVWAVGDTLLQRGGSALILLALASFTSPETVGIVAILTLTLTFYQAAVEAPLRQIAFRTLSGGRGGSVFIARAAAIGGAIGCIVMFAVCAYLFAKGDVGDDFGSYFLFAFVLVPLITSHYLGRLASRQNSGQWRRIATSRAVATLTSFVAAVAVILGGFPVTAVAVQAVVCESIFGLLLFAGGRVVDSGDGERSPSLLRQDLLATTLLSIFGWLRGQIDRVALAIFAGPGVLGVYTIGYAFARAGFDGAAGGSMNLFRSKLAKLPGRDISDYSAVFRAQLFLLLIVASFVSGISLVLTALVYRFFLDDAWRSSALIAPMLVCSTFASAFSWTANSFLNHIGKTRKAYWVQWFEISAGIGIAIAISWNIYVGVVLFVLRDVLCAVFLSALTRGDLDGRFSALWGVPCLASFVLALSAWWLVGGVF